MADLIKCPDCGKDVSPRAESCPECGCPIVQVLREPPVTHESVVVEAPEPAPPRSAFAAGFGGCFGVLAAIVFFIVLLTGGCSAMLASLFGS